MLLRSVLTPLVVLLLAQLATVPAQANPPVSAALEDCGKAATTKGQKRVLAVVVRSLREPVDPLDTTQETPAVSVAPRSETVGVDTRKTPRLGQPVDPFNLLLHRVRQRFGEWGKIDSPEQEQLVNWLMEIRRAKAGEEWSTLQAQLFAKLREAKSYEDYLSVVKEHHPKLRGRRNQVGRFKAIQLGGDVPEAIAHEPTIVSIVPPPFPQNTGRVHVEEITHGPLGIPELRATGGGTVTILTVETPVPETRVALPPKGNSAKQWAEAAYSKHYGRPVKIEPLTKTNSYDLGTHATQSGLRDWLQKFMEIQHLTLEPGQTLEQVTSDILAGRTGLLHDGKVPLKIHRDPGNPTAFTITEEVIGGTQRIYKHPTDPRKIIKVFDPSLVPDLPRERIAKLIQSSKVKREFLKRMINRYRSLGKEPPLELDPIDTPPDIEYFGIQERIYEPGPDLGTAIIPGQPKSPILNAYFSFVRTIDPPLIDAMNELYGGDLMLFHPLRSPEELQMARDHGHRIIKVNGQDVVQHGLDVGDVPGYNNAKRRFAPDGKEIPPVQIDE